jgi:hypothetical protein
MTSYLDPIFYGCIYVYLSPHGPTYDMNIDYTISYRITPYLRNKHHKMFIVFRYYHLPFQNAPAFLCSNNGISEKLHSVLHSIIIGLYSTVWYSCNILVSVLSSCWWFNHLLLHLLLIIDYSKYNNNRFIFILYSSSSATLLLRTDKNTILAT